MKKVICIGFTPEEINLVWVALKISHDYFPPYRWKEVDAIIDRLAAADERLKFVAENGGREYKVK